LVNFFTISGCNTHFKSELHQNGRQPAHEIFSNECKFQQFKSGSSKFKEACAVRMWVSKRGSLLKSDYLSTAGLPDMKMVADRHRHPA